MPAGKNHAKACEKGELTQGGGEGLDTYGAFCANEFWGACPRKGRAWDGWEDYLAGRERMDLNTKAQPRKELGSWFNPITAS